MVEILHIKRETGVAGGVAYRVTVRYPDEPASTVVFAGNTAGQPGPVVMITPGNVQTFVTDPGRCGSRLDESWVRVFFAEETENI